MLLKSAKQGQKLELNIIHGLNLEKEAAEDACLM